MAQQSYEFSQRAAKRITTAVSQVEKEFINGKPRFRRQSPVVQSVPGFWAKISGRNYTTKTYGWQGMVPKDDGTYEVDDDLSGTTSENPAREATEFMFVPDNQIVWMVPYHDYFLFWYSEYTVNGILDSVIGSGSVGAVSVFIDGFDTGQNITATNRYDDLFAGAKVEVTRIGSNWYIAPTTQEDAIVTVLAESPNASCLWLGRVLVPNAISSPCTGAFNNGGFCFLLVLNKDGGSTDSDHIKLKVGENYEGKFLFFSAGNLPVYGIRHSNTGSWFCEFELNNEKTPTAGSAFSVTVNKWWGRNVDPGATIDVVDTALTGSLYAHRGYDGDAGIAAYDDIDEEWRILTLRPTVPRDFMASLGATLLSTDSTASVGGLIALDGGDTPSITTVQNTFDLAGQNGSPVLIAENLSDSSYFLKQILHQTSEFVVDVTYDDTDHTWKKDVVSATVVGSISPAPEDILELTEVEPVVDVDTAGTALRQTKQKVYVAEANAEGSPTTIDPGTTCP